MQSSLTVGSLVALFGALVVLAAIPGISVLTVSTRSAALGLRHGVCTALGIVVGDIIFILLAIWGLALLAARLGGLFVLIKYLGGAYLIGLGIRLWRAKLSDLETVAVQRASLFSSFLTGLLITLADQKAILFYLGFFPGFLDLAQVTYLDTGLIIALTGLAVGGVKLGYAVLANRARVLLSSRLRAGFNRAAGWVMILVGLIVILRT